MDKKNQPNSITPCRRTEAPHYERKNCQTQGCLRELSVLLSAVMDKVKSRSTDEDEELVSTDPESKEKSNDKKRLGKIKWSREEDEKLKKLVEQHGTEAWKLVATFFPGRTDGQCQHRWQKVLNPELVKGPWTKEEDQKVIDLVRKYGPKRWSVIAKHLQGRIGKQCRERWHNHLNPEVKKSSWTQEEDRIIYEAHKRLGNRWAEISKLLPGRTDNSIKNHWNSTMRRKVEHEGYLQDSYKTFTSTVKKRLNRQCPTSTTKLQQHDCSPVAPAGSNLVADYQFDPESEQTVNSLPENPAFPSKPYPAWSGSLPEDNLASSNSSLDERLEEGSWRGPEIPPGPQAHLPISPSKFLAAEAGAVLSNLQTFPEFAETMELIDTDAVTWSSMAGFDMPQTGTPPRHNQPSYSTVLEERTVYNPLEFALDASPARNCAPLDLRGVSSLTPPNSSKRTQPSTGKRRREKGGILSGRMGSFLENITNSPKKTPTKSLPFTPSRFCNISGTEHLNLEDPALTSTPVCGQRGLLNTPILKESSHKYQKENHGSRTPKLHKNAPVSTPRTPTPFKKALAAQEKMHGPLKVEPQPLAFLEEDIREVLKQETGTDIFIKTEFQPEHRAWKHLMDGPARKVRKSLVLDTWDKDGFDVQLFQEQLNNAQLAEESLLMSSSLITSIAEQEESRSLTSEKESSSLGVHLPSQRPTNLQLKKPSSSLKTTKMAPVSEWEAVIYGKTEDQLIMTEQARQYLTPLCGSRAIVL
ncbi:myb-related protein A isoform X2 [Oryzias latipes]|uniref:MYB proto-onco like 1 n=1 Tax=Oryzias latipes TaxID=8090 RepID=A0A3B3HEX1_ORYLA|nr:myb-related protein A isoform X2 [Oryzias latipes]